MAGEAWNRWPVRQIVQSSSTISTARRRRPSGVKGAFQVAMKPSGLMSVAVNPSLPEGFFPPQVFTTFQGTT